MGIIHDFQLRIRVMLCISQGIFMLRDKLLVIVFKALSRRQIIECLMEEMKSQKNKWINLMKSKLNAY